MSEEQRNGIQNLVAEITLLTEGVARRIIAEELSSAEERISKRVLANIAEQVRTQDALRRAKPDRDRRG